MEHIVNMKSLTTEEMMKIIELAREMKADGIRKLDRTYYVSNLFFEPSTRTKSSFEMAERRLGMEVIPFAPESSSTLKGETLYDTVKTFEAIGLDLVVVRHPRDKYYEQLVDHMDIPLINGGDGSGQHPTQSLLDIFTIYEHFGKFEGLNVTIAGDISHSRVAKSNAESLKRLGANVTFVCPDEWAGEFDYTTDLDAQIENCDVLMLLRVQHERHDGDGLAFSKWEYHRQFGLTLERAERLQEHAIIMHPAPVNRGVEIADELIESPKSKILTQVENGVYVRAAIIKLLLKGRNE